MGKSSSGGGSAPAPDPNIGLAQQKMADIQEEYLNNWRTEVWPAMKEQTLKQESRADEQFAIDKEIQALQIESSKKNLAEYDRNAVNREAIYKEAEQYNTEANRERLAAEAIGDVKTAFGVQAADLERRNQSFGINPTAGRTFGALNANSVMQAATESAAATRARNAAEQLGWAKKMDAAGLAQGSFGNQATSTGLALGAGNQAMNTGQITMGNLGTMNSAMGNTFGQATQGWNSVGNLGVQSYGIQSQNYQAEQNRQAQQNAGSSAGWGSLAGAAIGAAGNIYTGGMMSTALAASKSSDIRMKENIVKVGELANGLGIYEFEYKPEFKDGKYAGYGRYRGVMAHEVEKVIPEAVFEDVNGYKVVDYSKVN